ncbi:hypothetical protein JCM10213_004745 [Rhodosporidiobolus nylandii]
MGLLPLSHHLSLIRDCFPPSSSLSSAASPSSPLPSALSNPLGKLTFYAVSRPAKTPKVVAALLDRASAAAGRGIAGKGRGELGVSVEIMTELVKEWGESGREDAAGVLRNAVAEPALRVAEIALGGGGSGLKRERDLEMEARGASLFSAVSTLLCPPFFAAQLDEGRSDGSVGGLGRAYGRCLALVAALGGLQGGESAGSSRPIALPALSAAARSEFLTSAPSASDYDRQVEEILPALLANVVDFGSESGGVRGLEELLQELLSSSSSSSALDPLPSSLSSRAPPKSSAPSSPPSPRSLAQHSLPPLLSLFALAPSPLALSTLLHSLSTFLSRYTPSLSPVPSAPPGSLGPAASHALLLFLLRDLALRRSPPHARQAVGQWLVDRVGEIGEQRTEGRDVGLLFVLKALLEEEGGEGVSKPAALHALLATLMRRARYNPRLASGGSGVTPSPSPGASLPASPISADGDGIAREEDDDPLLPPLLATLSAVARAAQGAGTAEMDLLAAQLVDFLSSLSPSPSLPGSGRATEGMSAEERERARCRGVRALGVFVDASTTAEGGKAELEKGGEQQEEEGENRRGASEATLLAVPLSVPAAQNGDVPGLHLGAVPDRSGEAGATVRAPKSSSSSSAARGGLPFSPPPPSATAPAACISISPSIFARTLPLLHSPSAAVRQAYGRVLERYLSSLPFSSFASTSSLASPASSDGRAREQAREGFEKRLWSAIIRLAGGEFGAGVGEGGSEQLPTAADFTLLLSLLPSLLSLPPPSSSALTALPALLHIGSGVAERWEAESAAGEREELRARVKACRQPAAAGVVELGRVTGVKEVERVGEEALRHLEPLVIPPPSTTASSSSPGFLPHPSPAPSVQLDKQQIVEALAADERLQRESGMSGEELRERLGRSWAEVAEREGEGASLLSLW